MKEHLRSLKWSIITNQSFVFMNYVWNIVVKCKMWTKQNSTHLFIANMTLNKWCTICSNLKGFSNLIVESWAKICPHCLPGKRWHISFHLKSFLTENLKQFTYFKNTASYQLHSSYSLIFCEAAIKNSIVGEYVSSFAVKLIIDKLSFVHTSVWLRQFSWSVHLITSPLSVIAKPLRCNVLSLAITLYGPIVCLHIIPLCRCHRKKSRVLKK